MSEFNPTTTREAWNEFGKWFNKLHEQGGIELPPTGDSPIPKLTGGRCNEAPDRITTWDDVKTGLLAWIDVLDDLSRQSEGS